MLFLFVFFFFNDTATTEIYTLHIVGSVRCVQETGTWVRSAATLARTHIKHYYVQRLLDKGFWRKLFFGRVEVGHALFGFAKSLITARQSNLLANTHSQSFQQKMAIGLGGFKGPVLLLLSGDDYTANEFVETVRTDLMWSSAFLAANVTKETLKGADHTFSSAELRQKVEGITRRWLETTVVEQDIHWQVLKL
eukprot:TRINITY_DN2803_c0_g1_i9.p1 TRINITY_DN2803_c0_g1~~TRINITY_DN2803_c0_g1_i9.p1  ORF type:complete len:194 (+),score=15.76 TRINITY_DN2803_c0_g1_i9:106-687(+)